MKNMCRNACYCILIVVLLLALVGFVRDLGITGEKMVKEEEDKIKEAKRSLETNHCNNNPPPELLI